ncbi:MAG TPA: hypothetical protein VG940_04980 [Gemmatimonadales bacterium]|nr:hypothetical protein [Gemmatimonadales bacterium]
MTRTWLFLPFLLVPGGGLAAQYTPNYPVSSAYQREELIRQQNEFRERMVRDAATAAFTARDPSWMPTRLVHPGLPRRAEHWLALSARDVDAPSPRRVATKVLTVGADVPLALTLRSAAGRPGHSLMIRTAITSGPDREEWRRMGEVTGGADGDYRIEVPAMPAGRYSLEVDVYDPDTPDAPLSSSRTPLEVKAGSTTPSR